MRRSLECSSRFLRALQQNRVQSRLLYLFYNKESERILYSQVLKWTQSSYDFKAIDLSFVTNRVNHSCPLY